jgi:hypothetical protein
LNDICQQDGLFSFWGDTHIGDGNSRRNGIVELQNEWAGSPGSEARYITQIVDGQTAGENQDAFLPGNGE